MLFTCDSLQLSIRGPPFQHASSCHPVCSLENDGHRLLLSDASRALPSGRVGSIQGDLFLAYVSLAM